ncbi:MAG: SWIM zinc finger family protein [Ilumatobacteraceae bacterium]
MTITVLPHSEPADASAVGKLAGTLLSVAVAGMAEATRFRKGRAYAADRSVSRIDVEPGRLRATVAGSRADPYRVTVEVPIVERGGGAAVDRAEVMLLTPDADDLDIVCTCPDAGNAPCKHAVAALLVFSNELGPRPELLLEWRTAGADAAPRVGVGARARRERHLRLAPAPPPPAPYRTPAWQAFEGTGLPPVPHLPEHLADTPHRVPAAVVDRVDVAEVVRSAIDALRSAWSAQP